MATTPTKHPDTPPPPPAGNPAQSPKAAPPRTTKSDAPNPLQELADQQKQAAEKQKELVRKEEEESDSLSLAEKETLATGERRARQTAGIEDAHYLESQADNERAQIEERVEEQAAAKRHPVTGEIVNVMGVPPRVDMAVAAPPSPDMLPENTKAEMQAGQAAIQAMGARHDAEHAVGRSNPVPAKAPNSRE